MHEQRIYPRPDESALAFVIERAHAYQLGLLPTPTRHASHRRPRLEFMGLRMRELLSLRWEDL